MSIAAIKTAAGAEPGIASVSTGITAPGTHALSPVSAAISPSIEPLPNFSGSLLARFAAAYELQAAISSPTPGITPIAVPIHPDRKMVFQCLTISTSLGMTESNGLIFTVGRLVFIITNSSAKPKAPTSAGTREIPPAKSLFPKLKRSYA